jgi:hypothetical protein
VLVLCHPVKNAAADNLVPLGAGAFLNEVDANLTVAVEGASAELHWQGKIRGQDFAPMYFQLDSVTHERLVTSTGKRMYTVVARHVSKDAREGMEKVALQDAQKLLADLQADPKATQRDRSKSLGWTFKDGFTPDHPKVGRLLKLLQRDRLAVKEMGRWMITEKGKKYLLQSAPSLE